jgi:hypothetical protein
VSDHLREVRVLTLEAAKTMAAAAEAFALGVSGPKDAEVADAGVQAIQG